MIFKEINWYKIHKDTIHNTIDTVHNTLGTILTQWIQYTTQLMHSTESVILHRFMEASQLNRIIFLLFLPVSKNKTQ